MLSSPEMDAMNARMTAIILRGSEGFFDDPKESEDLQITVRIACEFLQQSNDAPELGEAEYMTGTIRSRLDWFFSMAQTGGILTGLKSVGSASHAFGGQFEPTCQLKSADITLFRV
jgi:hypothetical protein